MRGPPHQLHRQQVRRQGGEEERAGDAGGGDGRPHQVAADPPRRGVVRPGIIKGRQVLHDREDGAAAARGVGRGEGRQHAVGDHHRIAERQGAPAEPGNQQQRQPPPQPGPLITEREDEGCEDQPDRAVGEARQRPGHGSGGRVESRLRQLLRREQHPLRREPRQHHAHEAHRRRGDGLRDQPRDDRREDGQEIPGMLLQARRMGQKGDADPDHQGKDGGDPSTLGHGEVPNPVLRPVSPSSRGPF